MSWSMMIMPLHRIPSEELTALAAGCDVVIGLPSAASLEGRLPTTGEVLAAITDAGCHGDAWFDVTSEDLAGLLRFCQDRSGCAGASGMDLGEIGLTSPDMPVDQPLVLASEVELLSFRTPNPAAVRALSLSLSRVAGPLLVFDDNVDRLFVVEPRTPQGVLDQWPWPRW